MNQNIISPGLTPRTMEVISSYPSPPKGWLQELMMMTSARSLRLGHYWLVLPALSLLPPPHPLILCFIFFGILGLPLFQCIIYSPPFSLVVFVLFQAFSCFPHTSLWLPPLLLLTPLDFF